MQKQDFFFNVSVSLQKFQNFKSLNQTIPQTRKHQVSKNNSIILKCIIFSLLIVLTRFFLCTMIQQLCVLCAFIKFSVFI